MCIRDRFVEDTVVVVPLTVKLPVTTTFPVAATSANVTLLDVSTACPIETAVPETETPVPAVNVVTFALPSKLTPLIVLAVASAVAVVALPLNAPVNCVDVNTPELGLYVKPVSDSAP